MLKKKKSILSLWDFSVVVLCVMFLRVHKEYLNNPLCTVSKGLVLNAAISSESSDLKKKQKTCICPQSSVYNLLQCKKLNSSFVFYRHVVKFQ